jgi:hypothetical protein
MAYRKSISDELMSIKDRARNFVKHWPEDGRYKEIILKNVLKKHLPKTVSVGTGFVVDDNEKCTTQIDIIVYSNTIPPLFCIEDFIIVAKESVLGIIEVKTKIDNGKIEEIMGKAHENGKLIGKHIFNGVFGYEAELETDREKLPLAISSSLKKHNGFVNNIAFGKDIFAKYWNANFPENSYSVPHYSFYKLEELAFGYFISNLIEDIICKSLPENSPIPETLRQSLYPIKGTKETKRIEQYEIKDRVGV